MIGDGYIGTGKYLTHLNGKQTKEYKLWHSMLRRCYSKYVHEEYKTYLECRVDKRFKSFQFFAEWCNEQIGFNDSGFCLDKDFIGDGKLYSPELCVFIPNILNTAYIKEYSNYFNPERGKFEVRHSYFGKTKYIGSYKFSSEAKNAYDKAKSAYLKEICEIYKRSLDKRILSLFLSDKAQK